MRGQVCGWCVTRDTSSPPCGRTAGADFHFGGRLQKVFSGRTPRTSPRQRIGCRRFCVSLRVGRLRTLRPESLGRWRRSITLNSRLRPSGSRSLTRRRAAATESSVRAHSVPRPAFGGTVLTLLRVRRVARLRRRPELDGASRPLRRAGSWPPCSRETIHFGIRRPLWRRFRPAIRGRWSRPDGWLRD
jgi:hypothetical protein